MSTYKVEYGCVRKNGQIDSNKFQAYLDLEAPTESVARASLLSRRDFWQTSPEFVDVVIYNITR